jgi:hypothetical protein
VAKHDLLRLGDTVEERLPVEVNGRTLQAYIFTNGRFPSTVAAELDDARNRWLAARQPVDPTTPTPELLWLAAVTVADAATEETEQTAVADLRAVVRSIQADEMRSSQIEWQTYLNAALTILIPGLEEWEADLLPPDKRLLALRTLGYLGGSQPQAGEPEGEPEEGGSNSPEASAVQAVSSTGDAPAPDSPASTA